MPREFIKAWEFIKDLHEPVAEECFNCGHPRIDSEGNDIRRHIGGYSGYACGNCGVTWNMGSSYRRGK